VDLSLRPVLEHYARFDNLQSKVVGP
jgi:hypothetical protein